MSTGKVAIATDQREHDSLTAYNPTSLKIAVIGAGIDGLSAAIALRQQGHQVTIFSGSRTHQASSSAIQLPPNANGLLRRWNIFAESLGTVEVLALEDFSSTGGEVDVQDVGATRNQWQHPWHVIGHDALHRKLHEVATTEDGLGSPATLHVSMGAIETIDCAVGHVVSEDGNSFDADVIIGADGMNSKVRTVIGSCESTPVDSMKTSFRFQVSRQILLQDHVTSTLVERQNTICTWHGKEKHVIMSPLHNNNTLDFDFIHHHISNEASTLAQVGHEYKEFPPALKKIISKIHPDKPQYWQALDTQNPPSWTKGRLALLGDAAHPIAPYLGQSVAQALEDAATLAVVLSFGTKPNEVPERLALYHTIRSERAHRIQEYSRQASGDLVEGKLAIDMEAYRHFNFGHDSHDHSTIAFRKWFYSKKLKTHWRMPLSFGPMPGPRQDGHGNPYLGHLSREFTTVSLTFKTSRTYLETLLPSPSFHFRSLGTVAYASLYATTLDNMSWLGGGGYTHCGLYVHDVLYEKRDGDAVYGTFLPVLFENIADPILSGREELGMNKLYCEIDIQSEESSYKVACSWRGTRFLTVALEDLRAEQPETEGLPADAAMDYGVLTYKYIPATGERGKADVEYACVIPHAEEAKVAKKRVKTVAWSHQPSMKFEARDWGSLPTLHHITSSLTTMPVYGIVFAKIEEGLGVGDMSSCRRIE